MHRGLEPHPLNAHDGHTKAAHQIAGIRGATDLWL